MAGPFRRFLDNLFNPPPTRQQERRARKIEAKAEARAEDARRARVAAEQRAGAYDRARAREDAAREDEARAEREVQIAERRRRQAAAFEEFQRQQYISPEFARGLPTAPSTPITPQDIERERLIEQFSHLPPEEQQRLLAERIPQAPPAQYRRRPFVSRGTRANCVEFPNYENMIYWMSHTMNENDKVVCAAHGLQIVGESGGVAGIWTWRTISGPTATVGYLLRRRRNIMQDYAWDLFYAIDNWEVCIVQGAVSRFRQLHANWRRDQEG